MFTLKTYQIKTINILQSYLESARYDGAESAFHQHTANNEAGMPRRYQPVDGLESVPYVCLRLPTGGGKTHLSVHAIKTAAEHYLEQDYPLVLLLVPTNAIRKQTLATLNDHDHPNRKVLNSTFGRQHVLVHDISNFTQIRPQDIRSKCVIVVGTMASLRVNNTDGRKVYAHNEFMEPHFARLSNSEEIPGLERLDDGGIKFSFRNLLAWKRPLLLIDEAHNSKSSLSMEVIRRIAPACILEFTATPAKNSNILHSVSAAELKAEEMIKLPVMLTEHPTWQTAVRDAIANRQQLHDLAVNDKDFIQPIVLFQAENKNQEVTVAVLEKFLVEEEKIPRERIAIATGTQKELDDVDLMDVNSKIQFVITVQALKEGWDCPFAYVFCSVTKVHSTTAVEQLLGRVLRMPYAKKRTQKELNRAYAHVSSVSWPQAVSKLHDRLVNMGFNEQEAGSFIEPQAPLLDSMGDYLQSALPQPLILTLQEMPDLSALSSEEREQVEETAVQETGAVTLTVTGIISPELSSKLIKATPRADKKAVKTAVALHQEKQQRKLTPSQKGTPFTVPQLALWIDGIWEEAQDEWFLDVNGVNLLAYPTKLSEYEFSIKETADSYLIDLKGTKLVTRHIDARQQFDLGQASTHWTLNELSRRLDNQLRQIDIPQEELLEFIRRTLTDLTEKRQIPLSVLVRHRYPLIKALKEKIKEYQEAAYTTGYQQTMFGTAKRVETRYEYAFTFDQNEYPATRPYTGPHQFNKHFYPLLDDMRHDGEEFFCAQAIDRERDVKHWVRNLVNPDFGFRLPLANGNFYPDFVAELRDGRLLVVEYKGAHLKDYEKEKEKRNIGELWEEKSNGKGLFLFALKRDEQGRDVYQQLEAKILGG